MLGPLYTLKTLLCGLNSFTFLYIYGFTVLITEQSSCLKKILALDEAEQKVRVKSADILNVSWS